MRLELRHLRILCAIADTGSLSQAAAALGFSQPAITAQLHRIEASLNGRVFHRGPRGASPTEFGLFVLSRARSVLVTMDDLAAPGAEAHNASLIRIGGYTTPVLTGLVQRLHENHGIEITVHAEYSPRLLLDLLTSQRLDLVATIDYPSFRTPAVPDVTARFIATEPIFIIMPSDHRLAARSQISLADLADEDWLISPPDGAGWPEVFYSACQDAGFAPRIRHMMSERDSIRTLVAQGRAIAPCQATMPSGPGCVVRPIQDSPLHLRHILAWRDNGPASDQAAFFTGLAIAAHQQSSATSPAYAAWLADTSRGDLLGFPPASD